MLWECSAIDGNKRTITPGALGVNGLGHQLFADPGFSFDQDGPVTHRHLVDVGQETLDFRAVADDLALCTRAQLKAKTSDLGHVIEKYDRSPGISGIIGNLNICPNIPAISEFETVGQVTEGYGVPVDQLLDVLNGLLEDEPVKS